MGNRSEIMRLPVGRFLYGSLTQMVTKDMDGKALAPDDQYYSISIGVEKNAPGMVELLTALYQHAMTDFANQPAVQQVIQTTMGSMMQNFTLARKSGFSWKISDGDLPNAQGRVNDNSRGCWVFHIRSNYAIDVVDNKHAALPPEHFKPGYYCEFAFTITGNDLTGDRAGIYVNPSLLKMVAFGEEITQGADPDEVFGNADQAPAYLPAGASQTPISNAPLPAQGMPGATPPVGNAPPAQPGIPQQSPQAGMPGIGAPNPSSSGLPAPANAFPSNQPPAQSMPPAQPGMPAQPPVGNAQPGLPQNSNLGTGYPSDPNFAAGPQPGMPTA